MSVSDTYLLRPAQADDCPHLTALATRSKASNGYDDRFMRACEAELTVAVSKLNDGEVWLAQSPGGKILGFFILISESGMAEVDALYVDPQVKSMGLGRRLWTKLEELARKAGVTRLSIDSDPFALPFYQAMGCRQTGETPSGSIPGRMLPLLEKQLD